jgi:hypothetical protein
LSDRQGGAERPFVPSRSHIGELMRRVFASLALALVPICLNAQWIHRFVTHEQPVAEIRGVVTDPQNFPMPDVTVEVYDHPEQWPEFGNSNEEPATHQRKLKELVTKEGGKFRFGRIKPGQYEVRFKKEGFDTTSVLVTVARRHGSQDGLVVELELSN